MSDVLDIDLGWKDLLKELRGLSKKEIKAGIQGGENERWNCRHCYCCCSSRIRRNDISASR